MWIVKEGPKLFSKTKQGDTKVWVLLITRRADGYFLMTKYWQIKKGNPTAMQTSIPYEVKPTNVGKTNFRPAALQAELEFEALIKKQKDKGYHEEGEEPNVLPQPMLAHKFVDHGHKIKFPAFVQPKLNGMRMLYDGKKAWSRGGKLILDKCIEHLHFDTQGHILDGELILPDNQLLQETMKAAKKFYPDKSPQLTYQVYDVIQPTLHFKSRIDVLSRLQESFPKNVWMVNSIWVESIEDIRYWHTVYTQTRGYEGTMVRDMNHPYEVGQRSYSLQKYKDFLDEEFPIVDVLEGEGSDKGLAIFVCKNEIGKTFNCRPEGTRESRAEMWKNRGSLIGKQLTVRYQELSADKVPIFPVGVCVRE